MKALGSRAWGALVVAMAAVAAPASAQKAGLGFGGSIGANVPNGDFGDGVKTGLVANGFVGVGTGRFGLRGELFWSRSDLDNAVIRRVGQAVLPSSGVGDVTGSVDLIGASANFLLPLTQSAIRPYVIGGVGVYNRRVSQDVGGTIDEFRDLRDEQTNVGYNGGLGLAFGAGLGPQFFIEARYHSVGTTPEKTRFVPVVVGFTF